MAGLLAALASIPASAAAFWVAVGLAIVANKRLVAADKFPYPVAAAGLRVAPELHVEDEVVPAAGFSRLDRSRGRDMAKARRCKTRYGFRARYSLNW